MRTWSHLLKLGVGAGLLAVACGGAAAPTGTPAPAAPVRTPTPAPAAAATPTPAVAAAPRGSVVVTIGDLGRQVTGPFQYTGNSDVGYYGHWAEPLIWTDSKGDLIPMLAKAWSFSADGLAFRMELQRGVKFHNGDPFTAADVKFSFEAAMDPAHKNVRALEYKEMIKSFEIADDYQITVHTTGPYSSLPFRQAIGSSNIAPKKYFEAVGLEGYTKQPIGSGPYKFAERSIGDYLKLAANEAYWQPGVPSVKEITLRIVPEETTRVAALKTGEADISLGLNGLSAREIERIPGYKVAVTPYTGTVWISPLDTFFDESSPLKDIRVRLALIHAVDRKAIAEKVYYGYGEVVPEGSLAPHTPGFKPLPIREYDPAKAKALLAEAGYSQGFRMPLLTPVGGQSFTEAVAAYWEKVGVKTDLKMVDTGAWYGLYMGHGSTMRGFSYMGWGGQALFDSFSPLQNLQSTYAWSYYKDPAYDAKLQQLQNTTDPVKRAALASELQKWMYDLAWHLAAMGGHTPNGVGPKVKEYKPIPGWGMAVDFRHLRLN